ncbi:MAG TPA: ABC transporter ATP-binding protein [Bacilli bacterium]|nr:ABC transporter ATP-binding protein [Bacilli bacterium]
MIEICKLFKKYGKTAVLNNVNLTLPRFGLIAIVGPSGCGKTTLLNCITGLCDYQGDIFIENKRIKNLSETEKCQYRISNFGLIFQDFKLYENESIKQNILLPLEIISNDRKYRKERKCLDLINVVGLNGKITQRVNKLSGGEKQRVAIARALVNDPKIILADEPTGSLDVHNGEEVMKILEKISKKTLVIVVSHDVDLMKRFADKIVYMKDGQVESINHSSKHRHEIFYPVCKNRSCFKRRHSIPFAFLFNHAFVAIKNRKWRHLFTCMVMSFGLIGVGLASSISHSISGNIKSVYSSLIDETKITISSKEKAVPLYGRYAGSYYEAREIAEAFPIYIEDIGALYYCDFESHFKDSDELFLQDERYRHQIDGLSSRSINEFLWLEDAETIYPQRPQMLEDDQAVFGLTIKMVEDICFALKIERTVTSLSNYLINQGIVFYFSFANNDWQYSDQQLVSMVGFTLQSSPAIYHSNHLWNEHMFETCMRFPVSDSLDTSGKYPWVMKKLYYFETKNHTDEFLKEALYSPLLDTGVLEIASPEYYPWLYKSIDIKERSRVIYFAQTKEIIPIRYSAYFREICPFISDEIFCSFGGYAAYPSSLMIGFSKPMYFSFNRDSLERTIDGLSRVNLAESETLNLPSDLAVGHYTKTSQNGIVFKPLFSNIIRGVKPQSLDEIVISTKMAQKLFGNPSVINKALHLAFTSQEKTNAQGEVIRHFIFREVKVVGLVDSPKIAIYHEPYWSISFFQSRLAVTAFDLQPTTISFNLLDSSKSQRSLEMLQKAFPQYSIINPLESINQSIDQICFYLEIALAVFSIISLIISILLLTITNYLHIYESRHDISLVRCLGAEKKEGKKFLFFHSGLTGLISYGLSSFELIVINLIINTEMSNLMHVESQFSFYPASFLYMLILFAGVSLISTAFISKKITSLSPLEGLKR